MMTTKTAKTATMMIGLGKTHMHIGRLKASSLTLILKVLEKGSHG